MTKEILVVNLCLDDIIRPDQAIEIIVNEFGLSPEKVTEFLNKVADFYTQPLTKTYKPWTNEDDDKLVTMFNEGLSPKEISLKLLRSTASVNQRIFVLRKCGYNLPSKRPDAMGNSYAKKEVS